jgi:hypothetical protein
MSRIDLIAAAYKSKRFEKRHIPFHGLPVSAEPDREFGNWGRFRADRVQHAYALYGKYPQQIEWIFKHDSELGRYSFASTQLSSPLE